MALATRDVCVVEGQGIRIGGAGRQYRRAGSEMQGQRKEQQDCVERWECEGGGGRLSLQPQSLALSRRYLTSAKLKYCLFGVRCSIKEDRSCWLSYPAFLQLPHQAVLYS